MYQGQPNPGSPAAQARGCTCNPHDNNGGRFAPMGDEWHVNPTCPVHDAFPDPSR